MEPMLWVNTHKAKLCKILRSCGGSSTSSWGIRKGFMCPVALGGFWEHTVGTADNLSKLIEAGGGGHVSFRPALECRKRSQTYMVRKAGGSQGPRRLLGFTERHGRTFPLGNHTRQKSLP